MNDKKAAIPSVAVFFVFINLSKKVCTEMLIVFGTDFFCLMIFSYNLE